MYVHEFRDNIIYGYQFYLILKIVDLARVLILENLQIFVLFNLKMCSEFNISGYNL